MDPPLYYADQRLDVDGVYHPIPIGYDAFMRPDRVKNPEYLSADEPKQWRHREDDDIEDFDIPSDFGVSLVKEIVKGALKLSIVWISAMFGMAILNRRR